MTGMQITNDMKIKDWLLLGCSATLMLSAYGHSYSMRTPRVDVWKSGGLEHAVRKGDDGKETRLIFKDGSYIPVRLTRVDDTKYLRLADGSCYVRLNEESKYKPISQPESVEHCK